MTYKKKLIEVALPLEAINRASVRENYIYRGNPSSVHKWWAQRPLAAARAVIFAQMVDDPSSHPELFPTEQGQDKERQRLFKIMEDLVRWENTTNPAVIQRARDEILQTWRNECAENADHPDAREIFDRFRLPDFHDPFAGGGTLPLEAQRLGLHSHGSDLNPVAVLINKGLIEIPPKFADRAPVNMEDRGSQEIGQRGWRGAEGIAADVRYYGRLLLRAAAEKIGYLYPTITVTPSMANGRKELQQYVGKDLTVIAWLWARTVKSPNPAFKGVDVPLAPTFMLSTRLGKEVYLEPVVVDGGYYFNVKSGKPPDKDRTNTGTKLSSGANFRCLMSGTPIPSEYIKSEGRAGRMKSRLMAIVAEGERGRVYLPASPEHEAVAKVANPGWRPDVPISGSTQYAGIRLYGMELFSQVFFDRQLAALDVFTDLIPSIYEQIKKDASEAGFPSESDDFSPRGVGATDYAKAITLYLAFAIDKHAMYGNTLVPWYTKEDRPSMLFTQQVLPMVWDPVEMNPFCSVGGSLTKSFEIVAGSLEGLPVDAPESEAFQLNASVGASLQKVVVSTDPPYYDNVPYADLSDFFYVWLRRALRPIFPDLFTTVAVPKVDELVAFAYRHAGDKIGAEAFFLDGMTKAMRHLVQSSHPSYPVTIYYAFKQSETHDGKGTASTGWETFLEAVIQAGFTITGTWPMRTERSGRMRDTGSNALASSIVLVCRPSSANPRTITRRRFLDQLRAELPEAVGQLRHGNIAPVDLAQSAIGPGMAIYTGYAQVLDAEGNTLTVREALSLINQVLDEILAEQEGDFDSETRFAVAWFEENGFDEGEFGVAELLSKAKITSVSGMVEAGIIESRRGKVRLLKPMELLHDWDPRTDTRLTAWEALHQLIQKLESGGDSGAAELAAKLGSKAETARELAYRLYTISERKKRANDALSYNALVQSWPEIQRLAREGTKSRPAQTTILDEEEG